MNIKISKLKQEFQAAIDRNKKAVIAEVYETKELVQLLTKGTHTKLTPEEIKKVHAQILDIIKTIPALAIFALPGGAFILPLVMKILPFNLLPDNFYDKEDIEINPDKPNDSKSGINTDHLLD
jgi:hypothetical protein